MTPAELEAEWARCSPWLEAALQAGGRTHDLADVFDLIRRPGDTYWFWPGERSAAVTEIIRHPRFKELRFWLAGGDLDEIRSAIPDVEAFAIVAGCSRFSILGRPGWGRALKDLGYTEAASFVWKELSS